MQHSGDEGAREWLGVDSAADAREMVRACSDEETCVVVFQLRAESPAGGGGGWLAGPDAPAGQEDGEAKPGYAWVFLAGKRPWPNYDSFPNYDSNYNSPVLDSDSAPSMTSCVRYAGEECQMIRRIAHQFRAQCDAFRGTFVGSVEHGVVKAPKGGAGAGGAGRGNATDVVRPRAGVKVGNAGASTGGPGRGRLDMQTCLQNMSDALGICERILPAIARLGRSATRLLVVSDAAMEGVPLGALPTATGAPWCSHFERNVVTAPSLAFACICRALFEHQRQHAEHAVARCLRISTVGMAGGQDAEDSDEEECAQGGRRRRVVAVGAPLGANAVFSGWEAKRVLEAFQKFAGGGECLSGDACVSDDIRWAARRRPNVSRPLAPERDDMGCVGAYGGQQGEGVSRDGGAAPCSTVMHLACHGRAVGEHDGGAGSMGLLMADRELLRCENVRCWDLYSCSLVVMSACSSALSCRGGQLADTRSAQTPSESARSHSWNCNPYGTEPWALMKLGLPGAFVCAGCPCVVGCLWEVASASTVALMLTFYHVLLSGDRTLVGWPPAGLRGSKGKRQVEDPEAAVCAQHEAGGARVSVPEALSTAQVWLQNASMEDVVALLPARGPTAACLRSLGFQTSADVQAFRQRRPVQACAKSGQTFRGEREPVPLTVKPFESPFYWAGFVCVGEG